MNAGHSYVPNGGSCPGLMQKREWLRPLTAGSAMMTDDWQQVVAGGLGGAVFGQERLQVQAFEGEWHMGAYLGGEHQFVSEALQVNTQDLKQENENISHFRSLAFEDILDKYLDFFII